MYRPGNYVKPGLEESLATIEKLDKPVVGYKVLGAGRVRPHDTLALRLQTAEAQRRHLRRSFAQKEPQRDKGECGADQKVHRPDERLTSSTPGE